MLTDVVNGKIIKFILLSTKFVPPCTAKLTCLKGKRVTLETIEAFKKYYFLHIEFQNTLYLGYLLNKITMTTYLLVSRVG